MFTDGFGGSGGGGGAAAAAPPPPPPPPIIMTIIIIIIGSDPLFLAAPRSLIELVTCVSIWVICALLSPERDDTRDAPPFTRWRSRSAMELNLCMGMGSSCGEGEVDDLMSTPRAASVLCDIN